MFDQFSRAQPAIKAQRENRNYSQEEIRTHLYPVHNGASRFPGGDLAYRGLSVHPLVGIQPRRGLGTEFVINRIVGMRCFTASLRPLYQNGVIHRSPPLRYIVL